MKESKNFNDYKKNWRDFLQYLERCWLKAERECQSFKNKFEPWQGTFKNLRKNDPLLKYLKNSRDVDQHSIQEIVEKIPGSTSGYFIDSEGNRKYEGRIDNLVIENGQIVQYEGDPMALVFSPSRVEVKPVTNAEVVYTIPTYHRCKTITKNTDPIILADYTGRIRITLL
jgi:hypothetical protein